MDAEETPERRAQQSIEREEKATNERRLVFWTWILALLTGTLAVIAGVQVVMFWKQLRLMKDGAKDATTLANAALDSAKALTASERAYIFVEVIIGANVRSSPSGFPNDISVKIWNNGKTPAEIIQIRAYPTISKETPQELLEFPGSETTLPPGLGIAKDSAFDVVVTSKVSDEELGEIERSYKTLYCVGLVRYRDIFHQERETGFCWFYRHHMQEARFIIAPNSQLNKRT